MHEDDEEENERFARCGKTFVDVRLAEDWQYPARVKRVRIGDVIKYFKTQAGNISSGWRSIAGIGGDWRQIDYIAQDCLSYFKNVNIAGIRREARNLGLEPKF